MKKIFLLILFSVLAISGWAQNAAITTDVTNNIRNKPSNQSNSAGIFDELNLAINGVVTASGTNTYTATPSGPAVTSYTGLSIKILFTNANTGASTLNLNSVGAAPITKNGTTALASGDLPAGTAWLLSYIGTNFQILGQVGASGGLMNSAPSNHLALSDGTNLTDSQINLSSNTFTYASGTQLKLNGTYYFSPSTFPVTSSPTSNHFADFQSGGTVNTVFPVITLSRLFASGTAGTGIGASLILETQTGASTYKIGSTIESVSTNITGGSEAFDLVFKNMSGGTSASEKFRVSSSGILSVNGSPLFGSGWTSPLGTTLGSGWAAAFAATYSAGGGGNPFADNTAIIKNNADNTKLLKIDASAISTGTTRTLTAPNFDGIIATRDANSNMYMNHIFENYVTTVTAAGTTVIDVTSAPIQYFTGSTTQTVTLPNVTTLNMGAQYRFTNLSSGVVTIQSSGSNTVQAMGANSYLVVTCILTTGTSAASWSVNYQPYITGLGSLAALNTINNSNWSGTALAHSNIASTAVTPGSYTNANITVAADGSVTAASNGSAGGVTSVTGTTNRITSSGGSTPAIDISGSYVGQSSITTLGTVGTGTWQGTKVGLAYGGTNADLSATGGTNNVVKQTSVGGAFTVAPLTRQDISVATQQVGTVFTESWTNLTNWTSVGTPSASVAGGQLSMSGTASTSTNYIKNNSYGKFNLESASITWTETVGTLTASGGIAFALVSNANLGATFQSSIMVNLVLSTLSDNGKIQWYTGAGPGSFSAGQISGALLSPVATNVITCTLTIYPDKYQFTYSINGGKPMSDTFIFFLGPGGSVTAGANATNFAFFNIGNTSNHTIGPVTIKSLHNKNTDYLVIGNSIPKGAGGTTIYDRMTTYCQKRTYSTFELNAQPNNSVNDINITEISAYNATKLILLAASNDVTQNGATTAGTDLATLLTALAGISNAAAPSGYSIANSNLILCSEIPRTGVSAIATYNTNLFSTYGAANIINLNGVLLDAVNPNNLAPFPGGQSVKAYTYDGTHPDNLANSLMADEIIRFLNLPKKDVYVNADYSGALYIPSSPNIFIGAGSTIAITNDSPNAQDHFITIGGYRGTSAASITPMQTAVVAFGMDFSNGFRLSTDNGKTVGTQFTKSNRLLIDFSGSTTHTQGVMTSAWVPTLIVTPGAHTGMTTATEFPNYRFDGATQTAAGGTTAIQRNFYIKRNTYAGTSGTRTITDPYGLYVEDNAAGTNGALTNNYAIGSDGNIALVTAGNMFFIKEGSNGMSGRTTLVSGTKAITVTGVTTSDHCFPSLNSASGATLTTDYQCVCTANTITLQANVAGQTINTADGSTVDYIIFRAKP